MTLEQLKLIVSAIEFQDWHFTVGEMTRNGSPGFYLQVYFWAADNEGNRPEMTRQNGRPWYVSSWATPAEVVQTALKAVLTALEHEAREQFLYQGKAIFGPHLDLQALLQMADRKVYREPVAA